MFTIVCAWCGKTVKDGVPGAPVSHLICTPCYEKEMRILDAKLGPAKPGFPPSGAPELSDNRNWLLVGIDAERVGTSTWKVTHEYRASGAGGWDPVIYAHA